MVKKNSYWSAVLPENRIHIQPDGGITDINTGRKNGEVVLPEVTVTPYSNVLAKLQNLPKDKEVVPVTIPTTLLNEAVDFLNPAIPAYNYPSNNNKKSLPKDGDALFDFVSWFPTINPLAARFGNGLYNTIDKLPTAFRKTMQYQPNSLYRLIGVGDVGYKDLLKSGIVRGNMHPYGVFTTKQLHKYMKALSGKLSEKDLRAFSSATFENEAQFNRINDALTEMYPKSTNSLLMRKQPSFGTYEDYTKRMNTPNYIQFYNIISNNIRKNPWLKNWKNYALKNINTKTTPLTDVEWNNLPTFAFQENEVKNLLKQNVNKGSYVGDYGVQINNADKYAIPFTDGGHFAIHPTTNRPVSINNPDLSIFAMRRGLLSNKPYMVKLNADEIRKDLQLINRGENPVNHLSTLSLGIENPVEIRPIIPSGMMYNFNTFNNKHEN